MNVAARALEGGDAGGEQTAHSRSRGRGRDRIRFPAKIHDPEIVVAARSAVEPLRELQIGSSRWSSRETVTASEYNWMFQH